MTPSATVGSDRLTGRMAALIGEIRAVVDRGLPPELTAYLVGERLAPHLLVDPNGPDALLTPAQCEGDPARYRQHVVHAEEDGGFSVVALVWLPGQQTPIHDHVSWCVAGVHQGQESETRYRLVSDGRTAHLVETEHVAGPAGTVAAFAPPGDIHLVRNACSTTAISIHVYGADVSRLGTSIRRVYRLPADQQR
ncbi:cysteine dioxygenase family protein [Kitasatospora aureofaciens]|uniref:cysteine dioxygenase family protein n=1 Tax=Kitasatospora aureofaciens TaxID=1894 RepID=UPI001C4427AB|nr:cysteine dioxygenase family protein [Kitasatospora aureofaciens]MBV6697984.1 cysteine dioxygenase family protein [Kitasatospora aureofaciens]